MPEPPWLVRNLEWLDCIALLKEFQGRRGIAGRMYAALVFLVSGLDFSGCSRDNKPIPNGHRHVIFRKGESDESH